MTPILGLKLVYRAAHMSRFLLFSRERLGNPSGVDVISAKPPAVMLELYEKSMEMQITIH